MSTCADQLVATLALASAAIATFRRGRGEDGGVSAQDLVVRPGDRVSASGRYVSCDDGEWLDLARVDGLLIHRPGSRSSHSVRLIGLDPAGVPRDFGSDHIIPGFVRVTGIWQDETIRVDDQGTVTYPARSHREFVPPCPAPAGGWDPVATSTRVPELQSLRASGAIVRDQWWCTSGGAVVLIVAASDVDLVERILGPRLPRRLCVVASRYSADQVHDVEAKFATRHQEWQFETWGARGLDQDGQPNAFAGLMRVTDDLADWADTLPDRLLDLRASMTPA